MPIVGLDIGGANLKVFHTSGAALSEPFEIWRSPHELTSRLRSILSRFPSAERLAVTMTAELADCFRTKQAGVDFILQSVEEAAVGMPVAVWLTSGRFASPAEARERHCEAAASNWQALATWTGRFAPNGTGLLVDIGSTTTDIIPLRNGVPCPAGSTDVERLLSGELIYTGVRRTPVCAVTSNVPLRGRLCPLAAEWFATMLDVHLVLGDVVESPEDLGTADNRPATVECALDRLARALCCDRTELSTAELHAVAEFLAECQIRQVMSGLQQVVERNPGDAETAIVSGAGEFLASRVLERHAATHHCTLLSLGSRLSPQIAESACAYAVAKLAAECGSGY